MSLLPGPYGPLLLRLLWLVRFALLVVLSPIEACACRGTARFRVVRLGGPRVRKVRGSAVDALHGRHVQMYRDSSIAPLLALRRRLEVAVDVLGEMILGGFTLHLFSGAYCSVGLHS